MRNPNQPSWSTVWGDSPIDRVVINPKVESVTNNLSPAIARKQLVHTLKNAYSGELGAINAYTGHRNSVSDPSEKKRIYHIEVEEICHRERVGEILEILGEAPFVHQDRAMGWVGITLGYLCSFSGWFAPMYGAGLLESRNIKEYEEAARYALVAGHLEFLDDLLTMAEVEWEHEKFFRERCQTHFLYRWFPKWQVPSAKETIRLPFIGIKYPEGQLSHTMNAEILAL